MSSVNSVALAGLAGAVWGLALARALAETPKRPASPTFYLGPACALALATGLAAVGLGRWLQGRKVDSSFVPLFLTAVYLFWPGVAPHVGWTLLGGSLALAALFIVGPVGQARAARRVSNGIVRLRLTNVLPYVLACVSLAFYLRTLGPTVGQADTFEFQVIAPTLGVAHPTGYPFYILCGKLFSLLPFGSVAWRVNLSSAVFATAAVVTLYQLIRRLTQPASKANQSTNSPIYQYLLPFIAALSFAFSRVFWSQAVVAEVYTLHNLFVAAAMLLLVKWMVQGEGGIAPQKLLCLLALLLGLSFANHLTTALLLPAVGLALLFVRPRVGWRVWLLAAGLFLLGLSLYLYIYFRWPALHDGVWMSPDEFWRYVTGQQFGGALRLDAWRTDSTRYQIVGRLLREAFGWPGLALSAVGLLWLAFKKWRLALITSVTFVAYAWYALSYYVPDVSVFLLPAHLLLAVWLGVGMAAILSIDFRGLPRPRKSGALISLCALLPLGLLWTNLPRVDQSGEREAYTWGERVLDLPLAPGAAILADSVRFAPLYYLQRIEGRRPDLDMVVLADEAKYRAQLDARVAAGQTVYLARFLPGLEGLYHLRSLGPLTEVGTAPVTKAPPLDKAVDVHFGDSVTLLGFAGPAPGPDGGVGLTLYWRAGAPIDEVYHVRLRLVDKEGQVWWQAEGRHAANNYYPTPAWRPGEVVADYHEIPPLAADPTTWVGGYVLQVGLFRPFSDEGPGVEGEGAWYSLTALDPTGAVDAWTAAHPLRARFVDSVGDGELILLGVDLPGVVAAGAPVELALHWRTSDAVYPAQPALTWVGAQGKVVEAQTLEIWGRSRFLLQAPASPGDYDLRLGWTGRVAHCGWLARPSDDCALAAVRVAEAAAASLANFDGQMLLLDAEAGATALRSGDSLPVTLSWQGLRPMQEDYTVSVQLVAPDGRLHGQTDAWPVQGTLPTSQWSPGQRVADPYQVTLAPDAPPGRYRVGIVVYLLATQTRLPLVDASGQAIGDIAWVAELEVSER